MYVVVVQTQICGRRGGGDLPTGDVCTTGAVPGARVATRTPFDGEHCAGFQGSAERRWRNSVGGSPWSTTRPLSLRLISPRSVRFASALVTVGRCAEIRLASS